MLVWWLIDRLRPLVALLALAGIAGATFDGFSSVPVGRKTSVVEPHREHVRLPSGIFSPQMEHSGMMVPS